jgi:hypothetical protein
MGGEEQTEECADNKSREKSDGQGRSVASSGVGIETAEKPANSYSNPRKKHTILMTMFLLCSTFSLSSPPVLLLEPL